MAGITKPPVRPIWADSAANPADIVDPGNTFITAGWPSSGTPPSRQRFNFALNYLWNAVRYFSRRGIPDYDAAETYSAGDTVLGPDDLMYISVVNGNVNNLPSSHPVQWTTPLVPTVALGNNGPAIASTNFVQGTVNVEANTRNTQVNTAITICENFTAGLVASESSARSSADAAVLASANATTAAGLALKANSNSPNLTGTPTTPTPAFGSVTSQIANAAFVNPGRFISTNGYVVLPSGLILQWGAVTVANPTSNVIDVNITFPIAFPGACFGVHPTTSRSVAANGQAINGSNFCGGFSLTAATLTLDSSGSGSSVARWWALGA